MSMLAPFGSVIVSVPTPDLAGLALYSEVGAQRSLRVELELRGQACAPTSWTPVECKHVGLVGAVGADPDVHQIATAG